MSYYHHMWTLPFISMFLGYWVIAFLHPIKKIPAPSLVGMRLEDSVKLLSQNNLNIRILGTKEDSELPSATIVNQTPSANTPLKQYQTMYCVISHKPQNPLMPSVIGNRDQEASDNLQAQHIRAKFHYVHSAKTRVCIAQSIQPQHPVAPQDTVHIYVSQGSLKPVIMPILKNHCVPEVIEFLENQGYSYTIASDHTAEQARSCQHCVVIDQWPRSGSFILNNAAKKATIQLQAKHKGIEPR